MTRQAISSTLGSSAADSSALIGGGASLCASGSQLWTGAQPILVASPASSSTNATSVGPAVSRARRGAAHASRARARSWCAGVRLADRQHDDPQQRDRQPERRQHEILPAGLERLAPPVNATSSADAAVVASTISQATARLPASGTASSAAQKTNSAAVVERARARRGRPAAPARAQVAGETSALHSPTTAITASSTPLAPSIRYQWPRSAGSRRARARSRRARARAPRSATRDGRDAVRLPRGAGEQREPAPSSGTRARPRRAAGLGQSRRPRRRRCRRCPSSLWIRVRERGRDRHDQREVEQRPESTT